MNLSSTNFVKRVRSGVLDVLLSLIYWLVVTPIAWLKRGHPRSEVVGWKDRQARIGWYTQEQSTSQKGNLQAHVMKVQSSSSGGDSARDDLAALAQYKGDGWMLLLYDLLTKLYFLAEPPKERELQHDLYVMF